MEAKTRAKLKHMNLLFVEDDDELRPLMARLLERHFGSLHMASNGQEGLEIFCRHKPDIVLTDISMPVMNGLEMVRAIRKLDPCVPILVVSAHGDGRSLDDALDAGVDKFLVKPICTEFLWVCIADLLQKEEPVPHWQYLQAGSRVESYEQFQD